MNNAMHMGDETVGQKQRHCFYFNQKVNSLDLPLFLLTDKLNNISTCADKNRTNEQTFDFGLCLCFLLTRWAAFIAVLWLFCCDWMSNRCSTHCLGATHLCISIRIYHTKFTSWSVIVNRVDSLRGFVHVESCVAAFAGCTKRRAYHNNSNNNSHISATNARGVQTNHRHWSGTHLPFSLSAKLSIENVCPFSFLFHRNKTKQKWHTQNRNDNDKNVNNYALGFSRFDAEYSPSISFLPSCLPFWLVDQWVKRAQRGNCCLTFFLLLTLNRKKKLLHYAMNMNA